MQNFSNSAAPPSLPPGFSGRAGGGATYPPQSAEPQISPRMTEEYVGLQQGLHRGPPLPGQASHMLAYSARNRGAVEAQLTQAGIHSGGSNPYRKEAMDYYFSMGAKDRHRRGGASYGGGGFSYPNIDGHMSHPYRHPASSSAPASGLMSPYPVDYGPGAGSGGGGGAFSPSHQYGLGQNPAMQAVPASQMQHRQHAQTFPAVHHGQQHRSYGPPGHRMAPQYPHYPPQGATSSGASGMYSPPPQRYLDGAAGAAFDSKANNSPNVNAVSTSLGGSGANNVSALESVQSYHAPNYPGYPPHSHPLHKQAAMQQRGSQHNLGLGYDNALKMQHQAPPPGSAYIKQAQNAGLPQLASQDLSKAQMLPNTPNSQIHQNFSPISNPSPAASAVHSPSCSSSPSPLMGVSETPGNAAGHAAAHPSASNPRSSRLLQTMPQLSPTPNSNSSISSCGSSGSHKALGVASGGGASGAVASRSRPTPVSGSREDSASLYSSLDRMPDAGLNSLSALSSQVANLPNTVQHMLLTDSVLAQKKRDALQLQQGAPGVPSQPRSRNASSASSTSTVKDGSMAGGGLEEDSSLISVSDLSAKPEREEQFVEGEPRRARQMSGASSGSDPPGYQTALKTSSADANQQMDSSDAKANKAHIPASLTPPFTCQPLPTGPASQSNPPPVSSPPPSSSASFPPPQSNCVLDAALSYKSVHKKTSEIRKDLKDEQKEKLVKENFSVQNGQEREGRASSGSRPPLSEREDRSLSEEQQNAAVGVIVSARADGGHGDRSKIPREESEEEKHSSSHNGEEGVDLSLYSSHHQKSSFGRLQSPPQSAAHKHGYQEAFASDPAMKSRGRAGPGGAVEPQPRYMGYQHPHGGYGSAPSKDPGLVAETLGKRGQAGVKGQEEQQFPSLLQEVLQGYNLDRRYGRPEQAYSAHLQAQQHFQSRPPYGGADPLRTHSGATEGMPSSAPLPSAAKTGNRPDSELDFREAALQSESSSAKMAPNLEKAELMSPSLLPAVGDPQPAPPKHINLADYSLAQRKPPPNASAPPSAVQELLLQEAEPLTELMKPPGAMLPPSERRSVICDVSPNRRGTPEREGEGVGERERSQSSVIQQPFNSPLAANENSRKEAGEKQGLKVEMPPRDPDLFQREAGHHGGGGANDPDRPYPLKSSVVMTADQYRRAHLDMTSLTSHPMGSNPLPPPSRHPAYLHGADLSAGGAATFPAYRYGETREGSMMSRSNPHFPAHHPYHSAPPQPQSNRLQMYRAPPHPHDMTEWVKALSRPSKDVMMPAGSSPGRNKVSQSEQRQRLLPQSDPPGELHPSKTPHQGAYYDVKMWESSHAGRESARLMDCESYFRAPPQAPPPLPPPSSLANHGIAPHTSHGKDISEADASSGAPDEVKRPGPVPPPSSISTKDPPTSAPPPRPGKSGGSGDANPLMLRRRVRSFISPIPAKRHLQDPSLQRPTNTQPPLAAPPESGHNADEESGLDPPCPRLSSPSQRETSYPPTLSPAGGNASVPPTRKGRGLKLEAIVQKITPNIRKTGGGEESNHYPGFPPPDLGSFTDPQDQDLTSFSRVAGGDDGYTEDGPSLNDLIPFRGVDDAGPLPPSAYPCDPHHTPDVLKQTDFDFGLGAAVASVTGDKEDFTLLGPLPPAPPLPRPVQGSPPPSSSVLSDIQQFTNTYQQLETRRGEQSAATLLRQKLQESGIGFDDYPGSDYYGATPPHHSPASGHMLGRSHMSSRRSSLSPQDSKSLESLVPKGYFPSGKKKGRPVGSVNKQKRAQNQTPPQPALSQAADSAPSVAPPISAPPAPTTPTREPPPIGSSAATTPPLLENMNAPPLAPPLLTQVVKVDEENKETPPETDVKPVRRRRRGVKDGDESAGAIGRQRRRRRGAAPVPSLVKHDLDPPPAAGGKRASPEPNRKGLFIPHIHVEKKVPEIGAVCTIINAEEEKRGERGTLGGKASVGEGPLASAPPSQSSRRERESEKREVEQEEAELQSGKVLPSSGSVVSGPVVTETNHTGRLLCCLCQKWANYKHLGDLYGPFYPAEYAAKLPKYQPQVRQAPPPAGSARAGLTADLSCSMLSAIQEAPSQDAQILKTSDSDYMYDMMAPYGRTGLRTSGFVGGEEPMMVGGYSSMTPPFWSSSALQTPLPWDLSLDVQPIPELKRELDPGPDQHHGRQPPSDESQQRPTHRKLTSHPRFKRRHKSSEDSPRTAPTHSKASLPFQPPPPALDSLGPLAQLAQLPQMPLDPEELWVHEGCIVWTSGVYLVAGRLYGLQEALDGARDTCCSHCEVGGSTLGCYSKGCTLRYHYLCAVEADCSLNEDNFSLRCPKHKFVPSVRPVKPPVEQSERG